MHEFEATSVIGDKLPYFEGKRTLRVRNLVYDGS